MNRLGIEGLHYGYGRGPVLDGVSLAVGAGEVVALLGRNGAGKSTLIKCALGVLKPIAGRIEIGGDDVRRLTRVELARRIAYVPQVSGTVLALAVADMVALGRGPHRATSTAAEDRRIVADCLDRLDLGAMAMRRFGELSGGEKKRVMIARALAQRASLLLLDEPTSDLDLGHQLETMALIRDLADREGVAVVMAIHDIGLAARFADRLVLMRYGRVHADGPPHAVLNPAALTATYDVDAIVGVSHGLPFVFPVGRGGAPIMSDT